MKKARRGARWPDRACWRLGGSSGVASLTSFPALFPVRHALITRLCAGSRSAGPTDGRNLCASRGNHFPPSFGPPPPPRHFFSKGGLHISRFGRSPSFRLLPKIPRPTNSKSKLAVSHSRASDLVQAMSALSLKADVNHNAAERPLIAKSGHWGCFRKSYSGR